MGKRRRNCQTQVILAVCETWGLLTFSHIHLMAVKPSKGLCSPGQGYRANHGFLLHRAADGLGKGTSQASAHQTLKKLHCRGKIHTHTWLGLCRRVNWWPIMHDFPCPECICCSALRVLLDCTGNFNCPSTGLGNFKWSREGKSNCMRLAPGVRSKGAKNKSLESFKEGQFKTKKVVKLLPLG